METLSLPSRERGLKYRWMCRKKSIKKSLPSRERGLKLTQLFFHFVRLQVAPLAGAWIEIATVKVNESGFVSLPSRERGLKCGLEGKTAEGKGGRSPRGSVD